MDKKISSSLKFALSLALAAVLLWFAFRGMDWAEFWEGLKTTRWGWILVSLIAGVVALVFRAERWRLQLAALDADVSRARIWHSSNIGNFLNVVIPGSGEFVRCGEVSQGRIRYDRTFGTILVERAWDMLAILVLLFAAVITNGDVLGPFMKRHVLEPLAGRFSINIWIFLTAGAALCCLGALLVWKKRNSSRLCGKVADAAGGVLNGITAFARMEHKALFLAYTIGIWVMYIIVTWTTFKAIPGLEQLNFFDSVFISAIGNIASVIPTPGNLGAYHYLVGLSLSTIYLGASGINAVSLLCATLSHGSHALLVILLAIHSYIWRALKGSKKAE